MGGEGGKILIDFTERNWKLMANEVNCMLSQGLAKDLLNAYYVTDSGIVSRTELSFHLEKFKQII